MSRDCEHRVLIWSSVQSWVCACNLCNDAGESPLEPATRSLRSASSSCTTATLKLLTSVMAEAMAGQMASGRPPPSRREVSAEKRSSWRFSTAALSCMPAIDSDLSSTTARIIPKATKNLGVFQSSPGIIRFGARRSTSRPRGNTAPQQKNPPAMVSMAGDARQ